MKLRSPSPLSRHSGTVFANKPAAIEDIDGLRGHEFVMLERFGRPAATMIASWWSGWAYDSPEIRFVKLL
jgi:hypothetical protein